MTISSMLGLRTAEPFIVGDLSVPIGTREATTIESGDVGDAVKDGDWVTRWGWLMEWGDGCIKPAELEALRHEGDPLCDAVVRFFKLKTGQDALKALETYIATTPREDWDTNVAAFWESIACDPPGEVNATGLSARKYELNGETVIDKGKGKAVEQPEDGAEADYTPDAAMRRLDRKPAPILSEGQAVFWRYSSGMLTTLLHFSLAGGFASARIMSVLYETGYLTSPSRDATYRRLMETTQALVDFMGDMTPITGKGWKSAVRVRMLHAQVRLKILDGKSRLNTYSVEKDGIPINQEDLAATLGGFCLAPLWCQRRLGIHLSPQEELAFIAAWRHIGYYLGIKPDLLTRFYGTNNTTTATRSHRFFACVAFHLFRPEVPKDPFSTPTYTILRAVAHRPPQDRSTLYHCELSRFLLGPGLADQLAVPRGAFKDLYGVQQYAWTTWASTQFGRYYRTGWEMKRQALFRRIITLIVAWQLGERRSRFAIKDEKDYEKKISELKYEEAGEPAGLKMGISVGKEVRRQARYLFIEMGCVIAGLGAACAFALWQTVKYAGNMV